MRAGRRGSTVTVMTDSSNSDEPLLRQLPLAYAVALRLDGWGAATEDIAATLGVDVDAIAALLEVGRRKLRQLGDSPT